VSLAFNMYPNGKAFLTPVLLDGNGVQLSINNPNWPITGVSWATSDSTKVSILQTVSRTFQAEVQAVGAVGTTANLTLTGPNGISFVVAITIVGADARTGTATASNEPLPVKERPAVGPPE
jgi:hypothetical protein